MPPPRDDAPRSGALAARSLPLVAVALLLALAVFAVFARPGAAGSRERGRAAAISPSVEVVLTSADLSHALTRMPDLAFSGTAAAGHVVDVNESVRDQTIKGFGGAMTDTSAWLIYEMLDPSARSSLMNALFAPSGIDLSFLRVPMGASDFTSGRKPFSYDDLPPGRSDPQLRDFSISHDARFTIPALQQALGVNPGMFILANPWSPPGWMKTNGQLSNVNDTGRLKRSSERAWAQYFVKFLEAYSSAGIHVDAVTPQNEPGQSSTYPGMNLSESSEATLVHDSLVPALRRANLTTKVYGYDWGWPQSQVRFAYTLARSPAARDLAGISTHCYRGDPTTMSTLHREAPALDEIVAECSPGIMPASTSEVEISSMRNWASALALWNLALDPAGGPVQPPNVACRHCTGIVTIDEATHQVRLTRDYYELGQISKFVQPGAVRIGSNHFVSYVRPTPRRSMATRGLDDVAFVNPDGSRVLVAYNNSAAPITFAVKDDGRYFSYTLAAGATATFVWNQQLAP